MWPVPAQGLSPLDDCLATLERLIGYPTVSADSNFALIAYLAERLESAGATVELLTDASGSKANLWATLGPDTPGGLVLSGHTDVVPVDDAYWTSDPFVMREDDGRLYGRGTCDMKGFIAACIGALPALAATRHEKPIHFAFTYDEEVGCVGARHLVDHLRAVEARPAMALIGEPTSMRIVDGHKGCCEYSTRFRGAEGHGSRPELGVNAVEYATRYVARLMELRGALAAAPPEGSRFEPPHTTISVGALTGGVAHNVIPGLAQVDWEMRPVAWDDALRVKDDLARFCDEVLLPEMRAISPGAGVETEVVGEVVGLEPRAENGARDMVASLLGTNGADLVAFGTEAGLFQGIGLDAIVCGPGDIAQAHKPDEFIAVAELERAIALLQGIAAKV
ncbi:MAG: acetylornithine deacetylase [Deinococcus-Thermus bacterium]|jgi:acetylornithine deacetylase|nr:acetylornithine deacetylase [Deinococcota bacterium]